MEMTIVVITYKEVPPLVSGELSSMEILDTERDSTMISGFQENLVVWKFHPPAGEVIMVVVVSGELSSMEISST